MAKESVSVERVYTVPLRREANKQSRIRRSPRAVNVLREYLEKHTKAEVRISRAVNEFIWKGGLKKVPGKVRIRVELKDGIAFARLPEEALKKETESKGEKKALGKEAAKEDPKTSNVQAPAKGADVTKDLGTESPKVKTPSKGADASGTKEQGKPKEARGA